MTNKLKCPFCGAELERCSYLSKGITNPVFVCRNRKCKFVDKIIDSEIWQALIDGKKAQDALKQAKDIIIGLFKGTAKLDITTTQYEKYLVKSPEESVYVIRDYREDAAQWLFDNYGIFWKNAKAMSYLTQEQKLKIVLTTKQED